MSQNGTYTVRAGVVGVGSMGQNHARVYAELPEVELVGVSDVDLDRAGTIADRHGVEALELDALLDAVDAVSIAVPTRFHYDTAKACIERGVHVLVEKPFVDDPARGRELVDLAEARDVVLQVGHIERFNPAVVALREIAPDLDIIAVDAQRLGPPLDREIQDTAVMDLMIHDIDVVLDLLQGEVTARNAVGAKDGRYAVANMAFDDGAVCQLTASRVTQEKVRTLSISAQDCRVKVDYIDQTVEIHRSSVPSYANEEGTVRYRHENVVERLTVDRREPLKNELRSFVEAADTGSTPVVTGEDGLRVLEIARDIDRLAGPKRARASAAVHADLD